jgi:hypothetical protein
VSIAPVAVLDLDDDCEQPNSVKNNSPRKMARKPAFEV